MSLKLKLMALVGLCFTLVIAGACKSEKAKEAANEACTQVARVCKDGSNAIRDVANSCLQRCPEDASTVTSTTTMTETQTNTSTVTQTQTQTNTATN